MARIPEAEIERIKREVSLERLIEASGVELKRVGKDLFGRCPFHAPDDTPSLAITPAKNLWHCLGACQAGGSVIDWVMRMNGVSFRHAVELLREGLPSSGGQPVKQGTVRRLPAPVAFDADDQLLLNQVIDYYHETFYLNQIWIELRTFAEDAIRRIWPQYEAPVEDATRAVELAYAQAGDRLMPEVDLFVAGLRADRDRSEKEKATVIHYNITVTGPGNVVQTGNQATANVQQVITANDSQLLVDALAKVLTFLEQTAELPDQQRRELVEVAKDAAVEAKKETPNRTKLAGLLGVLTGTIQALKAAKDVYDLLKTAAGPFGINLPDV